MHYSNLLTATLIRLFLFFLGLVQAWSLAYLILTMVEHQVNRFRHVRYDRDENLRTLTRRSRS